MSNNNNSFCFAQRQIYWKATWTNDLCINVPMLYISYVSISLLVNNFVCQGVSQKSTVNCLVPRDLTQINDKFWEAATRGSH